MLCINSSEIAKLVGYNKYTKKDDVIKIFEKYIYKQREDLQLYDEENNDIKILTDEEYIQDMIKDLKEDEKKSLNKIINSEITNNDSLQKNIKSLDELLENFDITQEQKNKMKSTINTKINCTYGINTEDKAIKVYEKKVGDKVFDNNTKCYTKQYNNFIICGKIDGLVEKNEKIYINEIKNRRNNIFNKIPLYEKIQLLSYTKLLDINNIIFTQCIDENQHTEVFENYKDDELWDTILIRLEEYSNLIYRIRDNNILRKKYINREPKLQYKFLKSNLSWL